MLFSLSKKNRVEVNCFYEIRKNYAYKILTPAPAKKIIKPMN
jgi:hypothetical protein